MKSRLQAMFYHKMRNSDDLRAIAQRFIGLHWSVRDRGKLLLREAGGWKMTVTRDRVEVVNPDGAVITF
jgi:hypothetical protein